jgi:uncharacterized protein
MKQYFASLPLKRIAIKLVVGYAILLFFLFFMQRSLLYKPHGDYLPPAAYGIEAQELRLPTADAQEALAWFLPPPEDSRGKMIVYFHGNGGGLAYSTVLLEQIRKAGFGYLALEYRGYPGYEGSPNEAGIYADARAAMEFMKAQGFPPENIILLGRSLGSAVALHMATEYHVGLLALVSPFTSMADVAAGIYWYVPARYLLLDRFDSFAKADKLQAPVYVFHGDADTLIPYALGQRLYERIPTQKEFFTLEGQGHNRLDMARVLQKIAEFTHTRPIGEILLSPAP